jgi:enterochelin esterase family protein
MQERMGAFEHDMVQVLIPFVDKTFRTLADRDHRAMAGLSMGGMETFQITFDHLDLFSYIGGFSGASNPFLTGTAKLNTKTAFHGTMADPAAFAAKVHLLWIGVGTNEPERMKTSLENLHAALDEGKIKHVFTSRQAPITSGRRGAAI